MTVWLSSLPIARPSNQAVQRESRTPLDADLVAR